MNELLEILVLAVFGLFGAALTVGAWLPRERGLADWLAGLGATGGAIGFGVYGVGTSLCESDAWRGMLSTAGSGAVGIGALLFAMGYLTERMQRRRREDFAGSARGSAESGGAG